MSGPIGNADYVMLRDTFILDDNRFIGHTNMGTYYVLLTKNITSDSITIYKQEITNINEGLLLEIPNDTTTQHHGWNNFHK